jgi:hypothetical protein
VTSLTIYGNFSPYVYNLLYCGVILKYHPLCVFKYMDFLNTLHVQYAKILYVGNFQIEILTYHKVKVKHDPILLASQYLCRRAEARINEMNPRNCPTSSSSAPCRVVAGMCGLLKARGSSGLQPCPPVR